MAILLSLESSTTVCSAALHDRGELVAHREVQVPKAAASQLAPVVDDLFRASGVNPRQLQGVAVSSGPGSYTGLRIGVATAKGICYGLDLPLIALDSLHVLACSIAKPATGTLLCPMIDARRMEVYTCLLSEHLEVLEPTRPLVVDKLSFAAALEEHPISFFGNGSDKCRGVIQHPNAIFIGGLYPKASDMGNLAFRKFENGDFVDMRSFEPDYLKEFMVKTKKT